MYRLNKCGACSPRDRLDPKVLEHIANQHENSYKKENGTCGCNEPMYSSVVSQINEMPDVDIDSCEYSNKYDSEFDYSLAMVYSPVQQWQNLHCLEEGFKAGTIFKELDKPFYGPKCMGGKCND